MINEFQGHNLRILKVGIFDKKDIISAFERFEQFYVKYFGGLGVDLFLNLGQYCFRLFEKWSMIK